MTCQQYYSPAICWAKWLDSSQQRVPLDVLDGNNKKGFPFIPNVIFSDEISAFWHLNVIYFMVS